MSIVLHIERVVIDEAVLKGESPARLHAALERELRQQLSSPGAIDALRAMGSVASLSPRGAPAGHRAHEGPGARIAAAVGQGLDIPPVTGGRHG
jgi:hypothetical protein